MRRATVITFAICLALFAGRAVVPFLTKARDMPAAITSPPALQKLSLDTIEVGRRLCMRGLTINPQSHQLRFKAGNYGKPGPRLAIDVTGPTYRASTAVKAGWPDNATLAAAVPPARTDQLVTVCIRNGGASAIALYAAGDRARSRAKVQAGKTDYVATPQFGFWDKRTSIADRFGTTIDRIATFRGPFSHAWIVWVLLALLVLGVPLAFGAALARGLRD